MRDIPEITARLRAVRNAREHFITLWALESAYDLPIGAGAVRQDIQKLVNLDRIESTDSLPRPFRDD